MTSTTRRRVFFCVLALAVTIPAETLFLQGLTSADPQQAVRQWAFSLSPSSLNAAAAQIQSYPLVYRKSIMAALTPAARVAVWQTHIRTYIAAHPELDANAVALLQTTAAAITPGMVSDPTDADRASIGALGNQIEATLGQDTALYLLYRLGPQDAQIGVSAVPMSMKIGNFIRDKFTVFARADNCGCEISYGCYDETSGCYGGYGCTVTYPWPACGFMWDDPCDGSCGSGG